MLRLLLVILLLTSFPVQVSAQKSVDVWFGTTTPRNGLSQGIYHAQLNVENGKLSNPTLAAEVQQPGFLALHPHEQIIYSVGNFEGRPGVAAFRINGSSLEYMNHKWIGDGGAAHLAVDPGGTILTTVQYGGGSVAVFDLSEQGYVADRKQLIEHKGGSQVYARRQDSPHPHWIGFDKQARFAFVPDLGMDAVVIYRVEDGKLVSEGMAKCPAGSGPRHMKLHPNEKFAYVLNELSLSISVFGYNSETGGFNEIETIPTLTEETKSQEVFNSASEIRIHPNGKFVYSANRGNDSISAFKVDSETGQLKLIEVEPVRGSWPRNFNIDPTGTWLIAAGRDSNTAAVFKIESDGRLTYTRNTAMVPSPICVLFDRRAVTKR